MVYSSFIRRAARRASIALALVGVAASPFVAPGAVSAQSNTFVVDSTRDLIDVDPSDNRCDADAGTGITCTLRAAIMQANATAGSHTIQLRATVYRLSLVGANEDNSATGDLDIKDDTIIAGTRAGKAISTIDAAGLGDRVIHSFGSLNVRTVLVTGGNTNHTGGGFYIRTGSMVLTDSIVRGNFGGVAGGGITSFNGTKLELRGTRIEANASTTSGGGIQAEDDLTLIDSTVGDNGANAAQSFGGGITSFGVLRVERSTVSGNLASVGAGIAVRQDQAVIDSSTISANRAKSSAGAIDVRSTGQLTLRHSTVALNEAPFIGGISPVGPAAVTNTLLANNTNGNCPTFITNMSGSSFNLSTDNTCAFIGMGNGTVVDALLGPLTFNGGSTRTHALLPGSPAIDRSTTTCPALDQRGVARPQNGKCDTGAFEFAP